MTSQSRAKGQGSIGWSHTQDAAPAFTPADLPDLQAWYRADNVTLSGSDVTDWPDNNGDSNLDLGSPGGSDPVIQTNVAAINNQSSVRFSDSVGDYLRNTHASFTRADESRVYVVLQETTQATNDAIFDSGNSFGNGTCRQAGVGDKIAAQSGSTQDQTDGTVAINTWFVLGILFNAASSVCDIDNVVDSGMQTLTTMAGGTLGFTLGANAVNSGWLGIDVAEVIISTAELSSGDKTSLFAYFNTRYGL